MGIGSGPRGKYEAVGLSPVGRRGARFWDDLFGATHMLIGFYSTRR